MLEMVLGLIYSLAISAVRLRRRLTLEEIWCRVYPNCPTIMSDLGFNLWLLEFLSSQSMELVFISAVTLWKLWEYRNKAIYERKKFSFDAQACDIIALARSYFNVSQKQQKPVSDIPVHWSPPPSSFYKVNFDATFNHQNETGATGVTIHQSDGILLAALATPLYNVDSPIRAEAQASIIALRFANFLSLPKIILEGDNLTLMNNLSSPGPDSSLIAAIINDSKILAASFEECRFRHVRRTGNSLADKYANFGKSLTELDYWTDNFPILT